MCACNFGGSGHNLTKLYQGMWLIVGVITWTLILGRDAPNKIWEGKRIDISKIRKVIDQLHFRGEKNLVNFGPLTKSYRSTQVNFFGIQNLDP